MASKASYPIYPHLDGVIECGSSRVGLLVWAFLVRSYYTDGFVAVCKTSSCIRIVMLLYFERRPGDVGNEFGFKYK